MAVRSRVIFVAALSLLLNGCLSADPAIPSPPGGVAPEVPEWGVIASGEVTFIWIVHTPQGTTDTLQSGETVFKTPGAGNVSVEITWTASSPTTETLDIILFVDGTSIARAEGNSPLTLAGTVSKAKNVDVSVFLAGDAPAGVAQSVAWKAGFMASP